MFCVLSPLSCAKAPRAIKVLKQQIVGFFDVNMSVNHYPVPLSAADTISSAGIRVGPGSPPPPPLPKEVVTN